MTDTTNAAALTADEQAQLNALQARANAARQAAEQKAVQVVRDLVALPEFKAVHAAMDAAVLVAPKNTELSYAANMFDRLATAFA